MPAGMQLICGLYSWPPAAVVARLASKILWYSAVSGACWRKPAGLVGSHCAAPGLTQVPPMSGYVASSEAPAAAPARTSTAANEIVPIRKTTPIMIGPVRLRSGTTAAPMGRSGANLMRDDRLSGGEVGLLLRPGTARRAAAKRIDG